MDQYLKKQLELGKVSFLEKKIVFLNTSIITNYGSFIYYPTTIDEINELIKYSGLEIISAIGHQSTAAIISELLGIECKVNRIQYQHQPGHIGLVFKLNGRPEKGKILSVEEIEKIGYSWGRLEMQGQKLSCYGWLFKNYFAKVREVYSPGSPFDGVYFWFNDEPVGPFRSQDEAEMEFQKMVVNTI